MSKKYFSKDHEWLDVEGSNAAVGITDYAQSELGDIVYIELPEVGSTAAAKEAVCVIESTKAASDVYSPISGNISETNSALTDTPELVNQAADSTFLFKLSDIKLEDLAELMDEEGYKKFIA